jgi:hypothetical protein
VIEGGEAKWSFAYIDADAAHATLAALMADPGEYAK